MTWQLGAFAVLALALAGGFAWYERARPDARVVALVGTLAAFAALGRIAFAAVPNVKPTTDIVLAAGFGLGAGPGFAVGAIAALTSNFFFGQGPWTPWQMAAWGATGILGAGLARARRGRAAGAGSAPTIGRWPLALVCCAAGFAFTAVQDVGDWVTYSGHTAAQLGAYVGSGLGFDAVHAGGCLLFSLAFGPALIRSIQRFARRLEVTWAAPLPPVASLLVAGIAAAMLAGAGLGTAAPRARAQTPAGAAHRAAAYLARAENLDGGFGGRPREGSAQLFSGWAALGLAAAGRDLNRMHAARGATLLSYVRRGAGTHDVGAIERTILVARAAGVSAEPFGGHRLVAELRRHFDRDGAVGGQVNLTAFGVLSLDAAGAGGRVQARGRGWLVRQQDSDGGWNFAGRGGDSDADDTGAVLEALGSVHGARLTRARRRAGAYLGRLQHRDGGFPSQPGEGSNAQSTAWAIQGLIAARLDAGVRGRALRYLRGLQLPDGAIRYSAASSQTPVWVTGEALLALEQVALPVQSRRPGGAAPSVQRTHAAFAGRGR